MSKYKTIQMSDRDIKIGQRFIKEDGSIHVIEKIELTPDEYMVWASCKEAGTAGWNISGHYNIIVEDDISGVQNYNPNNYKTMTTAVWNIQSGQSFMGKDGRVYLVDKIVQDGHVYIVNAITEGMEGVATFRDESYDIILKDPDHIEPASDIIGSLMQSAAIAGDGQVADTFKYADWYRPDRLWVGCGSITERRINLIQQGFKNVDVSYAEAAILIIVADLFEEKCSDYAVFPRLRETVTNAVAFHSAHRGEAMSFDMSALLMITLGIRGYARMESLIATGKTPTVLDGTDDGEYEIVELK